MPLFRRKTDKQQVPPELEPYYDRPNGWRLWVRRIIGFAAILLLVFLLVWTVAWVYRSVTDNGVTNNDDDTTIIENNEEDENRVVDPNEEDPEEVEPEDERERPADDDDDDDEDLPDTGDAPLPATGG